MGLAASDGRLIRPKDEPTTAKVTFDWCDVLNEGLVRSVELRQQKWIVKRAELELIAAKNFLLPKLDFVAQYRWLGLGNRLDGPNSFDVNNTASPPPDSNAYRTLTSGEFQEWQMGVQLNMPLGFRREMAGVRNAQLTVTRERTKLQEGELELSHQLAYAVRDLETDYVLSQTDFNRRIAAQRQVEAVAAAYETDTITLDVLLQRPTAVGPGRKRLLPRAGELQQVDRAGPFPQGLVAGIRWGVPGRRPLAGEGVFRRPPPRPCPRRLDVSRLRFHATEGHQPRADGAGSRRGGGDGRRPAASVARYASGPEKTAGVAANARTAADRTGRDSSGAGVAAGSRAAGIQRHTDCPRSRRHMECARRQRHADRACYERGLDAGGQGRQRRLGGQSAASSR